MFREDLNEVLQRHVNFASDDVKEGVLLHIENIDDIEKPYVKPLEDWNFPEDYAEYMEAFIQQEKVYWQKRAEVKDDKLPALKPYYGIAEHSALLGGNVSYGGNTSYHEHPLEDWKDFDKLSLSLENENFKMLLDSLRYLKSREKEEGFITSLRGAESPMDIANAIRGNDLFYDIYDEEENVHKLMELCLKAGKFTFKHQKEIVGEICGGVVSGLGIWLPGNSAGHLSEDASSMCATSVYTEFGKDYLERLLQDFDCTILHVHTMGRHVLKEFASIDKIKYFEFTYDPNQQTPIETYKENAELLKDKIVAVRIRPQEVIDNIEFLHKNKSILLVQDVTLQEAKQLVELVNSYRV